MMHDDLLELADHLARRDPGRPKQVSLRRAIATAYYAVFHALAFLCANTLVGWSQPWRAVTPIYRSLDHGSARKLFAHREVGTTLGEDAAAVGRIFILLQQARHLADYDPEPLRFGRGETLEMIDQARQAVQAIGAMPRARRKLLAAHLVARQR